MGYTVERGDDDTLIVKLDGEVVVDCPMGPDGPLRAECDPITHRVIKRPWFYTTSPYGREIHELYLKRTKAT